MMGLEDDSEPTADKFVSLEEMHQEQQQDEADHYTDSYE